jgi:hypothetical protein
MVPGVTTLPSGAESPTGWAGPAELNFLLQEVRTARANIEALRAQTRSLAANPEQRRLLESLENYVAALQARHLPVPPAIRDELALQRCLVPGQPIGRGAGRRQAGRR